MSTTCNHHVVNIAWHCIPHDIVAPKSSTYLATLTSRVQCRRHVDDMQCPRLRLCEGHFCIMFLGHVPPFSPMSSIVEQCRNHVVDLSKPCRRHVDDMVLGGGRLRWRQSDTRGQCPHPFETMSSTCRRLGFREFHAAKTYRRHVVDLSTTCRRLC